MVWPEDDFDKRVLAQERYILQNNLRLSFVRDFSKQESGLTKLVFDSPKVVFMYKQFIGCIDNIEFYSRKEVTGNQTFESKYERIILPVWMMQGTINGDREKTIRGVIRPRMHDSGMIIEPLPDVSSEFQFYIDKHEGHVEGRSIENGAHGLLCIVRNCAQKNPGDINPYFAVDINKKFDEMCMFQTEK